MKTLAIFRYFIAQSMSVAVGDVINQPIMYGPTKQLIAAAKTAQPIHMKKHDFIPLNILSYLPAPRFCPQ